MRVDTVDDRISAALKLLERIPGRRAVCMELRRATDPGVVLGGSRGDDVPWSDLFAIVSGSTTWSNATIDAGDEFAVLARKLTPFGEVSVGVVMPKGAKGAKSMHRAIRLAMHYMDPAKTRLHSRPKEQRPDPADIVIPKFF